MRFGSVCSGIEAASAAWEPLGWKAAWFAEIEKAPCSLLAERFPDTPNYGDMTGLVGRLVDGEIEAPDMLCGGTPCQAFSVAGLRRSLDDDRGNLSLIFCGIADAIDDARRIRGECESIIFWENVPGVLNTKDNAFGCFLGALAGEDIPLEPAGQRWTNAGCVYGPKRAIAWRVLDAQYFGLAQRRKRVFVIASAREGFDPAQILFEFEGMRRDSAPSREAGQGFTYDVAPSLTSSGRGVERAGETRGQDPVVAVKEPCWWDGGQLSQTLDAVLSKGQTMPEKNRFPAVLQPVSVSGDISHTLKSEGFDASEDGTGRGVPVIAFGAKDHGADACVELSPTLRAGGHNKSHAGGGVMPAIAFAENSRSEVRLESGDGSIAGTLSTGGGKAGQGTPMVAYPLDLRNALRDPEKHDAQNRQGVGVGEGGDPISTLTSAHVHGVATSTQVRRLMPIECERLQGFPDNWTLVTHNGKPMADGPRYKAIGKSWAVAVVRWIGGRIDRYLKAMEAQDAA